MKLIGLIGFISCLFFVGCSKKSRTEQRQEDAVKREVAVKQVTTAAITEDKRNVEEKIAVASSSLQSSHEKKTVAHQYDHNATLERGYRSPISGNAIEDRIVARVNGENILLSDLNESRIDKDGQRQTLDEAIAESLLIHKGVENKFKIEDLEVEKQIANWKEQIGFSNKSDEAFEAWLKEKAGLTIKRAKRQFRRMLMAQQVKGWLLSDKGFIAPKRIREYFEKNQVFQEDRYNLRSAFVERDDVHNGKLGDGVVLEWVDLGWIEKTMLSEKMSFIGAMAEGEISAPIENEQGFQVIQLVDTEERRLKTFEEREVEITKLLQDQEVEKAEKVLIDQLKDKASIVYLDPI